MRAILLFCVFVSMTASGLLARSVAPISDEDEFIDIGQSQANLAVLKSLNFAVGSAQIRVYDLINKKLVRAIPSSYVNDLEPFKQNQLIQAADGGKINIWNVETGELIQTLQAHSGYNVRSVVLNKDQSLMLSGGNDYKIILWDMVEFKQIRTFTGHTDRVRSLFFDEARNRVISGSDDNTIGVWNMNDGSLIKQVFGHPDYIPKVSCGPRDWSVLQCVE